MSVAIIDYGSGNLHSARKAFERAAREAGVSREIKVTARPEDVLAADHDRAPGRRRFRRLPPRARRRRRHGRGAGRGGAQARAAVPRHLRRRAAAWRLAASNTRSSPGLNWIAGDVAPIKPRDPGLKIPHMGWNTLDVDAQPSAFRRRRDRPERTARLFRPLLSALRRRCRRHRRDRRLWRPGDGDCRARQHRRHAVPSREEPDARPGADRQFPASGARDPVSRHRSQERRVRPPRPRRHGAGDRVQRRPRRSGAGVRGAGVRLSACRRSRRRVRRQAGQRRGGPGAFWPGSR